MKRALLAAGSTIALVWCGGDRSPVAPTGSAEVVRSLRVTGVPDRIDVSQTTQLAAVAGLTTGESRDVTAQTTWRSFDAAVATVSASGMLQGVAPGRTSVQATHQGRIAGVEVLVLPAGTYVLTGRVFEGGNLPLVGARIEVVGGPQAGRSTTTPLNLNTYGLYGVSGELQVRASKDGYAAVTRSVTMTENRVLDFELTPTRPPTTVAGQYRLTFEASAACASRLREDARVRTYDAQVDQDGARLLVTLVGEQFELSASRRGSQFSGVVQDGGVSFALESDYYYYYYYSYLYDIVERLSEPGWSPRQFGTSYLTIEGSASGSLAPAGPVGTLSGSFLLWRASDGFYSSAGRTSTAGCSAPDHRFSFSRR
jgi:hypothetical protein